MQITVQHQLKPLPYPTHMVLILFVQVLKKT